MTNHLAHDVLALGVVSYIQRKVTFSEFFAAQANDIANGFTVAGDDADAVSVVKDGRYEARIMVGGKRYSFMGATINQAQKKMKAFERSPQAKDPQRFAGMGSVKTVVSAFLEKYALDVKKGTRKDRTWRLHASVSDCWILPRIGNLDAVKLGTKDILDLLNGIAASEIAIVGKPKHEKAKRTVGARTLQQVYDTLKLAFKSKRPDLMEGVDRPRYRAPKMAFWDGTQARRFIDYVTSISDPNHALYLIALRTGARIGELVALSVGDFDLRERTIHITKTYNEATKSVEDTPKTAASNRTVELTLDAFAALKGYIEENGMRSRCSARIWPYRELSGLRKAFRRVSKGACVPRIRVYDLRHTFATTSMAAGVPIKVIAEMMGHTDVSMVLKTYGHVTPGMHRASITAIAAAF